MRELCESYFVNADIATLFSWFRGAEQEGHGAKNGKKKQDHTSRKCCIHNVALVTADIISH